MADGRMLKRNISNSKRLSELQSDAARMLWTWIIPYLDVEGRFYASPDLIKGKIVPRLKTFNEENIEIYLKDMARVGLVVLYKHDNEIYLQYRKFDEFQSLRKDREGKPLPAPDESEVITPGILPENSGDTPAQIKLREVKLREANAREDGVEPPVDNSNGKSKDAFLKKIQDVVNRIKIKFPDPYFNQDVLLFIQTNMRRNPDAIIHCLESILKAPGPIIKPKAYLEAAMKVEDGKFNAAESERISDEHKTAPINLGAIIGSIGKPI